MSVIEPLLIQPDAQCLRQDQALLHLFDVSESPLDQEQKRLCRQNRNVLISGMGGGWIGCVAS